MLMSMIQEEKERKENKQQQQKPDAVGVRGPKTLRSRAPGRHTFRAVTEGNAASADERVELAPESSCFLHE